MDRPCSITWSCTNNVVAEVIVLINAYTITPCNHVTLHGLASPGLLHGPLVRYVKLQVAHAPGIPGTFSPAADFKGNR